MGVNGFPIRIVFVGGIFLTYRVIATRGGGGGVQLWYHCMAFFPYFFTFLAHIFKDCGEGVAHLVRFFALSFYTQLFCLSFSLVFSSTLVS